MGDDFSPGNDNIQPRKKGRKLAIRRGRRSSMDPRTNRGPGGRFLRGGRFGSLAHPFIRGDIAGLPLPRAGDGSRGGSSHSRTPQALRGGLQVFLDPCPSTDPGPSTGPAQLRDFWRLAGPKRGRNETTSEPGGRLREM